MQFHQNIYSHEPHIEHTELTVAPITGCYEDKAKYFATIKEVFAYPNVTDEVLWMLQQCQQQKLLID